MTMEFWFIAALIPILSAAVLCYVIVRLIWAGLRGFGTLLGLGDSRRVTGRFSAGMGTRDARSTAFPAGRRNVAIRTASAVERQICAAEDCRHVNAAHARYCAQCGRRLTTA